MPLYKFEIREQNGEQEYRQDEYVIAPSYEAAEEYAKEYIKDWYDEGEPGWDEGTYEVEGGAIEWELGGIGEVCEFSVFDVEKSEAVHIPLVLPSTDPAVQEYLADGGSRCPKCKSYNIQGEGSEYDNNEIWHEVYCLDCGAQWTDIYKLADIEYRAEKEDAK